MPFRLRRLFVFSSPRTTSGRRADSCLKTSRCRVRRPCGHDVGAPRRSDLSSARALDDHEPRVGDRSATWDRSRHDPVRAGRERMASDPAAEPDTVDASVALDAEPPDAAAAGCNLDDDELDDGPSAQHEDERRPFAACSARSGRSSRGPAGADTRESASHLPAGSDWRRRSSERRRPRPLNQRCSVPPSLRRCSTRPRRPVAPAEFRTAM